MKEEAILNGGQFRKYAENIRAFLNNQEWEGIAKAVNIMCIRMQEKPFYEGYAFSPRKNNPSDKGYAQVCPCNGAPIEINSFKVFKALIIIMYCSWLRLECFEGKNWDTKKESQYNAYLDFKGEDEKIYQILD